MSSLPCTVDIALQCCRQLAYQNPLYLHIRTTSLLSNIKSTPVSSVSDSYRCITHYASYSHLLVNRKKLKTACTSISLLHIIIVKASKQFGFKDAISIRSS